MSAQVVVHRELIVHPAVRPMAAPSSRRCGDDMEGVSIDRSGSSLFAVREWRAGDSTRHMHWRSTARRGQNMVAELTVPSDFGLALLVTGDGRTQVTEEWVSHLASTCINALRSGRAVSVTGGPATRRMVTYGTAVDILDWFAAASVPDLLPVSSLPDCFRRVGVGGEVLVATIGEIYPNWQPAADELARQYGVAWSFLRAPGAMSGAVS
ncbi:MAG TPA: DUF58 domain-containing protein [Actinomycetes bacterium]|nr:DUF58 domain-containing protein [Actinomycetes bacterium]